MLQVLVPGFEPAELESLEELEVGVAWTELADPLVRARVEEAAARFPRRRPVELPLVPNETYAVFMREVADVHRELFAEHARRSTARTSGSRSSAASRCATPRSSAQSALRAEYRERMDAALDGLDLVLTPTLPIVAPPARRGRDRRPRRPRAADPLHAIRSPRSAGPPSALPCGAAEDGLPASLQLVGRAGSDALVLAAARVLSLV